MNGVLVQFYKELSVLEPWEYTLRVDRSWRKIGRERISIDYQKIGRLAIGLYHQNLRGGLSSSRTLKHI